MKYILVSVLMLMVRSKYTELVQEKHLLPDGTVDSLWLIQASNLKDSIEYLCIGMIVLFLTEHALSRFGRFALRVMSFYYFTFSALMLYPFMPWELREPMQDFLSVYNAGWYYVFWALFLYVTACISLKLFKNEKLETAQ